MNAQSNREKIFFELADSDIDLKLASFRGFEGISQLFEFEVELISQEHDIEFAQYVGQSCVISISLPNQADSDDGFVDVSPDLRFIHGVITDFATCHEDERYTTYLVSIAPKIYPLVYRQGCRIFQKLTVIEIIKKLLKELGMKADEYQFNCTASYEPYEYKVQYRESEINFIERLLEAEGIFYYFVHEADKHIIVFEDNSTALPKIVDHDKVFYNSEAKNKVAGNYIYEFRYRESLSSGHVSLRDYNFLKPNQRLESQAKSERFRDREIYDYPGQYSDKARGDRMAKVRMEAIAATQKVGQGRSNIARFIPGYCFDYVERNRGQINNEYLITRIEHFASQSGIRKETDTGEGTSYNNSFTCILASNAYRSLQRTRVPSVEGVQTAIVVGRDGEEVDTDEHGRVKVQFHWDREGQSNEESSCWVRVSHLWAGAGYGSFFLPRIGQEVIVDFIEGNPDNPIVTGRVYNGVNRPPYVLPDNKTISTIKTNSTQGGSGFNELRFEDKKNEEQIFIHAQKNQDVRVKNSHFESIGNQRHLTVSGERFETVKKDAHLSVQGDTFVNIKGDTNLISESNALSQINGDNHEQVNGSQFVQIDGDENHSVGNNINIELGGKFSISADGQTHIKSSGDINLTTSGTINLSSGGSFISISPSGVTIKGPKVKINSGGSSQKAKPVSPASPNQPDEPELAFGADTGEGGRPERTSDRSEPIKPTTYGPQAKAMKYAAEVGVPFLEPCKDNQSTDKN